MAEVLHKKSAIWGGIGGNIQLQTDLIALIEEIGGGGTTDYTDLENKPQVNGVALAGNKTTSDLGITAAGVGAIPRPSSATAGQFLVYNGTAWVAKSLSTWSGGSY